ncbi:sugar (Glycoside-Pentoside-Hexuronide) transporter subfamily [Verrucomicrobiia bacterium DG1235]|nr:sugar (Glycoside-Pentoside-Hexuronide) transporter subfamily [Verrucomicrobiae bacterium DG1235]
MPLDSAPQKKKEKLSFTENFGFGLGDMASNFFFQTFNIFLLYYYTDVFGIGAAAAGTMFIVTRALDAFTDPAMGIIADRTNTRWGKYRPYLLWMAIPYGICGYLIFANPDLEGASKLVYAYITYSLMMLAYTAINVPYSSLMGVLSPSSFARTIASNFRFVGAFGGGLAISMFVRPLVEELGGGDEVKGFQYAMGLFAVISILLFWVTFATTKERVKPPVDQKNNIWEELGELVKNKPWIVLFWASVFSVTFIVARDSVTIHFFKYVAKVGDEKVFWILDKTSLFLSFGKLSMMIGVFCVGFFVRFCDKRALATGLTLTTAVCLFSFYFIPVEQYTLMVVLNIIGSFAMGPTSALVWSMYGDVADYGEHKFGRRSTGLIHSASLFSLKMGSMIAGALGGYVLAIFGFVRDVEQTDTAILGIVLMFTFIPAFFAVLKAIALWVYPLDSKKIAKIEAELQERKANA